MSSPQKASSRPDAGGQSGVEVLLVGPEDCALFAILEAALERDGWPTVRVPNIGDLAMHAGSGHKAVVVIRTSRAEVGLRALEDLEPWRHSSIVVVVADRADPGEYFCLMQAGATEYFEVSEDPTRILQGVEWAARVLAP